MDNLATQYDLIPSYDYRDQVVSLNPGPVQILTSNIRRVAVLFSHLSTVNKCFVRPVRMTGVDEGFLIPSSRLPLRFRFPEDGTLSMLEWFAVVDVGPEELYICEILYTPRRGRDKR